MQIGEAMLFGYPIGVGIAFGGAYVISSINIGRLITDQVGLAGTRQGLQVVAGVGQPIQRFRIDTMEARNTTIGAQFVYSAGATLNNNVSIGRLEVTNADYAVDIGGGSYVFIDQVITDNLSDAVYHITGTPRLAVGMLQKDAVTPAIYSAASGGLVPALAAGWTNVGGTNDAFGVDLVGGMRMLHGLVCCPVSFWH